MSIFGGQPYGHPTVRARIKGAVSDTNGSPEPSLSVRSRPTRMANIYNIPAFRAPIVSARQNDAAAEGPPALSVAPRNGFPYPQMRLAPVQQGLGIQPELVRFPSCFIPNYVWSTKFTLPPIVQVHCSAAPQQHLQY